MTNSKATHSIDYELPITTSVALSRPCSPRSCCNEGKTPRTIRLGDFEPSDVQLRNHRSCPLTLSCDKLYNTASLLHFAFRIGADVASFDDDGYFRDAAFAEQLRVAEIEEVDDRSLIGGLGVEVLLPLLLGNERPELVEVDHRLPAGEKFQYTQSIPVNFGC